MISILSQTFSAFILTIILIIAIQIINSQNLYNRRKNSPFECGFDPLNSARIPFSQRFFLLAIIFLIFDIEIALLFPLILRIKYKFLNISILCGGGFLIILIIGLIHEWKQGTLRWVICLGNNLAVNYF